MYFGCKGEGTLEKVFEFGLPQNGIATLWIMSACSSVVCLQSVDQFCSSQVQAIYGEQQASRLDLKMINFQFLQNGNQPSC